MHVACRLFDSRIYIIYYTFKRRKDTIRENVSKLTFVPLSLHLITTNQEEKIITNEQRHSGNLKRSMLDIDY